jgi:hypothetical protein
MMVMLNGVALKRMVMSLLETLEEKGHAVRDWPRPTDQRQLKSFLGLASYYRKFV